MQYMRLICIAATIVMSLCRCSNSIADRNPIKDSIAYQQHAISFITQICSKEDSLFILDKTVDELPASILDGLMDDHFLSKEEKQMIKGKMFPAIKKWRHDFFPQIRLIDKDSFRSALSLMPYLDRQDYVNANISKGITSFGYPIFLRNYTYCLFYRANQKDGIGGGNLVLYKQKNSRWVVEKEMWEWIT